MIENNPNPGQPTEIRGDYSYSLGKVSIQPEGTDKVIHFFAANKPWGSLGAPINASLRNRIQTKKLVPITVVNSRNGKSWELYVKASKIDKILTAIQRHERNTKELLDAVPTARSDGSGKTIKNIHAVVAKKIFRDREDFQEFDTIEDPDSGKMIRYSHSWNRIKEEPSGGYSSTAVSETLAFKTFNRIEDEQKLLKRSERVERILTRVNPDGTAVGIQKKPISPFATRTFTVYSVKRGEVVGKTKETPVQVEEAFIADCYDALGKGLISKEEIPSIAACLVQGSKTLLANGIYHMDVKLENIGYTGPGTAIHFDLDGAIDTQEKNWIGNTFIRTEGFFRKYEMDFLQSEIDAKNEGSCKERLEQMHIFQLGLALWYLQTGNPIPPYDFDKISPAHSVVNDIEKELLKHGMTDQFQRVMTARMLHPERTLRPPISEIEKAFHPNLITAGIKIRNSESPKLKLNKKTIL